MNRTRLFRCCSLLLFYCLPGTYLASGPALGQQVAPPARAAVSEAEFRNAINANTVIIMASGPESIFTRFAVEMQKNLDDRVNNSMRILPVIGNSGEQNMVDLLYLKHIDVGITDDTMLAYFREQNPERHRNIDSRVLLITKLLDNEFHIVARDNIRSIEDLQGKTVNFYQAKSSTAIVAEYMFRTMGIRVNPVYYEQEVANKMLKNGEIDAVVRANGKPVAFVQKFKKSDGVHLIPIEPTVNNYEKLIDRYSPTYLKHDDYPDLIPEGQTVSTLANATVLATYAWPQDTDRYKKVSAFVAKFFDSIQKFMVEPNHPKWREINLAAKVAGWQRFKPAQDWLDTHKTKAMAESSTR